MCVGVLEHVEKRPVRGHLLDRGSRETVLVRCWLVKRKRGDHQQLSHLGKASSDHVPRTRVGDRYGGPPVLEPREARRRRAGASRASRTPSIRGSHAPPSTASREDECRQHEPSEQRETEAHGATSCQLNRHSGRVHHFPCWLIPAKLSVEVPFSSCRSPDTHPPMTTARLAVSLEPPDVLAPDEKE